MNNKYPPPQVPEGFCVVKQHAQRSSYWVVRNSEGTGLLWLDCTDAPEYYIPSVHDATVQAEFYEQAKSHIEALLFLGEVK